MSLHVQREDSAVILEVRGQLVVSNWRELRQTVLETLEAGARNILVDFEQTSYIDSSGVSVLVHISNKIREKGGQLRLANLNEDLKRLFELTRLDSVFQIADSRKAALASF